MKHLFWLALLLTGCASEPREFQRRLYVFGTLVEIQAYTNDEQAFSRAMRELQTRFRQMHTQWHAWKGNGQLRRINAAFARGECAPVDATLRAMLEQAAELERATGGLFNPAIGRLVALWGFHTDDFPIEAPPPEDAAVRALVEQRPSLADLRFPPGHVCSDNPAVAVDLGGFAKGVAVDEALALLARHGISDVMVNAGGDLRVAGSHGQRHWRIAIRHPGEGTPLATIEARDGEAVFTSGNYYRYLAHAGKRYAHILDPRTGYPVEEIQSATVIASTGALADAAATALVVAGTGRWLQVARGLGVREVMLVTEDGTVYLTPEMKLRLRYLNPPAKEKVRRL